MKAKLTLNGKEYEVELSEEQATDIENANKLETGFGNIDTYPRFRASGALTRGYDEPLFSNKKLCEDYARAINLFLELSEWQANNDDPISGEYWFEISYEKKEIRVSPVDRIHYFGVVRFRSREKALEAIDKFRDKLAWYFTEFKPRLDM